MTRHLPEQGNPPENQREVGKFRKKQVTVEAVQWTGENREAVEEFVGLVMDLQGTRSLCFGFEVAIPGDYFVRDTDGNVEVFSATVFEETYEPA